MSAGEGWRRLALEVAAHDAEPASALLGSVTGTGVVVEQREGAARVVAQAYLQGARASRAARALRPALRQLQREGLLRGAAVRSSFIRGDDWKHAWKRHHQPLHVADGFWVAGSWQRGFRSPKAERTLVLDPAMAFGTGQHPTTRLALELMLPYISSKGSICIDAGCGSGILGLAAASRGALVYAFDEDPIAVEASRSNFKRNRLAARAVVESDSMPASFPKAQVIVANLTAEILQQLAAQLASKLAKGGALVSGGITQRGRLATLYEFARAGLAFVAERRSGEWFAYVHRL